MDYIVTRGPDDREPEGPATLDEILAQRVWLCFPADFGGELQDRNTSSGDNRPLLVDLDGDRRPPFGLELDCAAKIATIFAEIPF